MFGFSISWQLKKETDSRSNMPRATKYFSWEKKEKQCNHCDEILPLKSFREANNAAQYASMASFYSYACRLCESAKAKKNFLKRKAQ